MPKKFLECDQEHHSQCPVKTKIGRCGCDCHNKEWEKLAKEAHKRAREIGTDIERGHERAGKSRLNFK